MANKLTNGISSAKRSVIRQLEELLPQIEDGLARGYSHAVMHAELPALGINISLPYYHRALRLLRKERREGKQSVLSTPPAPVQLQEAQSNAGQPNDRRANNLSGAIAEKADDQIGNISVERTQTQPFRWKGQEFLDKDWSKF